MHYLQVVLPLPVKVSPSLPEKGNAITQVPMHSTKIQNFYYDNTGTVVFQLIRRSDESPRVWHETCQFLDQGVLAILFLETIKKA